MATRRASAKDRQPYTASTTQPGGLRTWRGALNRRTIAPARIVAMGSSTVEGQGTSAYGKQMLDQLVERLRSYYPTPGVRGGIGFVPPAQYVSGGIPGYPAVMSGGATLETATSPGWASRSANLSAAGHTVTFTLASITGFQLTYGQFGGAGVFSYSIDGGTAVQVNGANATTDRFKSTAIIPVARGAHTITVAWVSGTVYLRGLMAYDQDEQAGIQYWNGGTAGSTSTSYQTSNAQWIHAIAAIQPHLVLLDLGRNDYTAGTQISPATMLSNLQSIISLVRANCQTDPSFAVYVTQRLGGTIAGTQWDQYRAAYQALEADLSVRLFDLQPRQVQPPQTDNSAGLYLGDLTHLTDKGHSAVAEDLFRFLQTN